MTEPLRAELVGALDTITDALLLCVHRAQAGLATAAEDACNDELARKIWQTPIAGPLHGQIMKLEPYLWPVDLMMLRDRNLLHSLGAPGAHYRNEVARACRGSTTAIRDELGPALAFADRRTRALALATAAFKFEQEQVGDDFDEEALAQLTVDAVLASEMSAVLALWLKEGGQQEVASAFATCSGALRSAVWLWLEDDDRAMGCLRVLIEQVARARTWRMKPQSAIKLEARSETTPRDWIEKCGWRRLGVLLKSLGEFVHGANPNHWATARDVLVSLNPNPDRDVAKMSGRTNCLADLIVVLDGECADWLALIDSELANAFWEVAGLTRENFDTGMESNMQRAWLHRHLHTRKHG